MDRATAYHKWQTLGRYTVERGCTAPEAETARRLQDRLAARWGFERAPARATDDATEDDGYAEAEAAAAQRYHWEYRRCGKPRCRCNDGHLHGPYKYTKRRMGAKVRSIYLGR